MISDQEKYDLIEKYQQGNLSGDEQQLFEELKQSDEDFSDQIDLQDTFRLTAAAAAHNDLRAQMNAEIGEFDRKSKSKRVKTTLSVLVLSFALICAGVYLAVDEDNGSNGYADKPEVLTPSITDTLREVKQDNQTQKPVLQETDKNTQTVDKINNSDSENFGNEERTKNIIPIDTGIANAKEDIELTTVNRDSSLLTLQNKTSTNEGSAPTDDNLTTSPINNVDCDQFKTDINLSTKPSCSNKPNGELSIDDNSSSSFFIGDEQIVEKKASNLYAGDYLLKVVSTDNCSDQIPFTIGETDCSIKNTGINPNMGEVWLPIFSSFDNITIQIVSAKSQKVVYTYKGTTDDFQGWDGKSQINEELPSGLYVYIIEYQNGSLENGQITLTY